MRKEKSIMELTIENNEIVLVLGTKKYKVSSWVEVQEILEEHLKKLKGEE
jgi:hypothetical protein